VALAGGRSGHKKIHIIVIPLTAVLNVARSWFRFWNGTTTSKDVDGRLVLDPTDVALAGARHSGFKTTAVTQFYTVVSTHQYTWFRFWDGTTTSKDVDGRLVPDPMDVSLAGARVGTFKNYIRSFFVQVAVMFPMHWLARSFDGVSTIGHDFEGTIITDPDLTDPRRAGAVGRQDFTWAGGLVIPYYQAPKFYNGVITAKDVDGSVQADTEIPASERSPHFLVHFPVTGIGSDTWPILPHLFLGAEDILEMDPKSP
jgi:hypothetical protein